MERERYLPHDEQRSLRAGMEALGFDVIIIHSELNRLRTDEEWRAFKEAVASENIDRVRPLVIL